MRNSWAAHPTGVMRRGRTPPVAQPMAQTAARQWPSMVDTVYAGELSPEPECPYQATRSPAHQGHGSIHTPTIKQSPSMVFFPHQQAEKSLQNQHDLSILIVGLNQLKHRLSRTSTPKRRHKTNTFCPLTRAPGPAQAARARTKPRDSSGIPGLGAETAGFEPARGYAPLPP